MEKLDQIKEQYKETLKMFSIQRRNITRLWNINQETGEELFRLVLERKPTRILEVGTSNGFSTFWLSRAAACINIEVDTVDVDEDRQFLAKDNLSQLDNINFYLGLAGKVIPSLEQQYDFIFLDANKSLYLDILIKLLPKLRENSWIIADNTISHQATVNEYLDYVRNNDNFVTSALEIGTGLELSIYKKVEN